MGLSARLTVANPAVPAPHRAGAGQDAVIPPTSCGSASRAPRFTPPPGDRCTSSTPRPGPHPAGCQWHPARADCRRRKPQAIGLSASLTPVNPAAPARRVSAAHPPPAGRVRQDFAIPPKSCGSSPPTRKNHATRAPPSPTLRPARAVQTNRTRPPRGKQRRIPSYLRRPAALIPGPSPRDTPTPLSRPPGRPHVHPPSTTARCPHTRPFRPDPKNTPTQYRRDTDVIPTCHPKPGHRVNDPIRAPGAPPPLPFTALRAMTAP